MELRYYQMALKTNVKMLYQGYSRHLLFESHAFLLKLKATEFSCSCNESDFKLIQFQLKLANTGPSASQVATTSESSTIKESLQSSRGLLIVCSQHTTLFGRKAQSIFFVFVRSTTYKLSNTGMRMQRNCGMPQARQESQ